MCVERTPRRRIRRSTGAVPTELGYVPVVLGRRIEGVHRRTWAAARRYAIQLLLCVVAELHDGEVGIPTQEES